MTDAYQPREIERRWQAHWKEHQTFRALNPGEPGFDPSQPKFYVLDMFPYPSGAGLHVGHPIGYIGSDIVARRKRMDGCNVLHPMGYDAFGLPAEQYAIQTGQHPRATTEANIANFRRQLELIGLSFDWSREFATSEPRYYKWTQWIFKRLFERGLAYQAEVPVWWCEELKTVLANEEVINGRSERGDHPCERRPLKQWMFKITAYADRLLEDLTELDWPENVKQLQRNWIGRSEGAQIEFPLEGRAGGLEIFTTRPDTAFGATFMVIAPEHPLVAELTTAEQRAAVEAYVRAASAKSDLERTDLAKDKTGVFTGAYCINPAVAAVDPDGEGARVPIWVADYVLSSYGTGAIMAVPGQDERDFEFAEKFGLRIVRTVQPPAGFGGKAYTGEGPAIHSGFLDGLGVAEAKAKMIAWLEETGRGKAQTTYRLRDWLFSRQRYWGEPFPLVHHPDGRVTAVPDEELPVELPDMDDFTPVGSEPPLGRALEWVATTDEHGRPVKRETDTMPGWAGSCWYYLRFMDPHNDEAAFSREAMEYWGSVDLYVGGVEHAVLHLLYARFWHKVLFDIGLVKAKEPFLKYFNQGMVTAFAFRDPSGRLTPSDEVREQDGKHVTIDGGEPVEVVVAKMSKSLKNVVRPDDVAEEYGVDTFRVYEMFMGPLADSKPWNPRDVSGSRRFLDRVWRMIVSEDDDLPVRADLLDVPAGAAPDGATLELEKHLHRAIQRIDDSFGHFNFNTGIAALMAFVNEASKNQGALTRSQAERFVLVLSPFAPHLCEELWRRLGHGESLARAPWPRVDATYLTDDEVELVAQVNGKVRGKLRAPKDAQRDELERLARDVVGEQLAGKQVVKTVVVPGRLVNFVVR